MNSNSAIGRVKVFKGVIYMPPFSGKTTITDNKLVFDTDDLFYYYTDIPQTILEKWMKGKRIIVTNRPALKPNICAIPDRLLLTKHLIEKLKTIQRQELDSIIRRVTWQETNYVMTTMAKLKVPGFIFSKPPEVLKNGEECLLFPECRKVAFL